MKSRWLVLPFVLMGVAIWGLPKASESLAIETLGMTSESKAFEQVRVADAEAYIDNNGVAYYNAGQNNYIDSNGVAYYSSGQNNYIDSNGVAYYNSGQNNYIDSNGNAHYNAFGPSLGMRFLEQNLGKFPQPQLRFASRN